ncbi:MAG: shikimate dehydrogenase [Acutalibacteraceae bacterium]
MKYALIGYPLGHSVSPFIHNKLFSLNGADAEYTNIEIAPNELNIPEFAKEYDGFNVTIPYKTEVIPFLTELCGKAQYLKTVNTVKNDNGKLYGYNTDADGMLKSLEMSGISLSGNVLICGAGGTARMLCCVAVKMGCNVTLCVRNPQSDKVLRLKSDIMRDFGANIDIIGSDEISGSYGLLMNATPAGMYPKFIGQTPASIKLIEQIPAVFDAVYNPRETELIKIAKQNGAKVAYGLPMLVYQAAAAQTIWYGADFNDDELKKVIDETEQYITQRFS